MSGKKHTLETIEKMRVAHAGKHRERLLSYNAGFKKGNQYGRLTRWTLERRKKIGLALRRRVSQKCDACNIVFETRPSETRRFCSHQCHKYYYRQEIHWNWKGGLSSLAEQIKATQQYKNWRFSVFKRDNFMCVICKRKNGVSQKLQADHIIPRAFLMKKFNLKNVEDTINCEAFWDITNGRTLCTDCHKLTPTFGWKMRSYVPPSDNELGIVVPEADKLYQFKLT